MMLLNQASFEKHTLPYPMWFPRISTFNAAAYCINVWVGTMIFAKKKAREPSIASILSITIDVM